MRLPLGSCRGPRPHVLHFDGDGPPPPVQNPPCDRRLEHAVFSVWRERPLPDMLQDPLNTAATSLTCIDGTLAP